MLAEESSESQYWSPPPTEGRARRRPEMALHSARARVVTVTHAAAVFSVSLLFFFRPFSAKKAIKLSLSDGAGADEKTSAIFRLFFIWPTVASVNRKDQQSYSSLSRKVLFKQASKERENTFFFLRIWQVFRRRMTKKPNLEIV